MAVQIGAYNLIVSSQIGPRLRILDGEVERFV